MGAIAFAVTGLVPMRLPLLDCAAAKYLANFVTEDNFLAPDVVACSIAVRAFQTELAVVPAEATPVAQLASREVAEFGDEGTAV